MTQPIDMEVDPVAVPIISVGDTVLEVGKKYRVTLLIDSSSSIPEVVGKNEVELVEEIITGPDEPANKLCVLRNKTTDNVYLGDSIEGQWRIGYNIYGGWQKVLETFKQEDWEYLSVV